MTPLAISMLQSLQATTIHQVSVHFQLHLSMFKIKTCRIAKHKSKGLDYIITQLATKYKITPAVKSKVKKAING